MLKKIMMLAMLFAVISFAQNITQLVQPGCFYRLNQWTGAYSADSLFRGSDTSYTPRYYNGNTAQCKGLWVARGTASGFVCVQPLYNTMPTRYRIYIDSTLDCGYPIPFLIKKFYKNGTTIPLDSIGYFPIEGN